MKSSGRKQHNGAVKYRVEEPVVIGQTVAGTGNSFPYTTKKYDDFILKLEFKVAEDMNSGIQFSSEISEKEYVTHIKDKNKTFPADRIHGYQYEIDTSDPAWTDGVFDKRRRGLFCRS